jgi:hypothetical protein
MKKSCKLTFSEVIERYLSCVAHAPAMVPAVHAAGSLPPQVDPLLRVVKVRYGGSSPNP